MKPINDIYNYAHKLMDKALRISFANLKHDISSHSDSLEKLNSKIKEQDELIRQLMNEISTLKEQEHSIKE
jgi:peptidoglycan hydrolase CwlO-like protein